MSADNCLAILATSDGQYRVADIHMIWLNDDHRLERLMFWAEHFNFSPVFTDAEKAGDYADELHDKLEDQGHFIEYGIEEYSIPMTFADFYAQAQAKGYCNGLHACCDYCQKHTQCRKFEESTICVSCHAFIVGK